MSISGERCSTMVERERERERRDKREEKRARACMRACVYECVTAGLGGSVASHARILALALVLVWYGALA